MTDAGLELDYEVDGLPAFPLPPVLAARYGGPLGFARPRLYANFVTTLDGVVAIPSRERSNRIVSGDSEDDRFVMGLLRACADAVVVGAGTLAGSPRSLWTPERAFPGAAAAYAELRRGLGYTGEPELVVLTASGLLDPGHPALEAGALVLTSERGAERLAGRLPASAELLSLGAGESLDVARVGATLAARGHTLVLSEGGPHTIGPLLQAGLVDELFLTVSPLLLGRPVGEARLALVEGTDLLGESGPLALRLLSIRRSDDHLFLRYALGEPSRAGRKRAG